MKIKKILAGHFLVLALIFPNAGHAADFNLNLKTVLTNLHPDVSDLKVKCQVFSPTSNRIILGQGSTTEKVPASGEINKNIQVKFNASSGKNPADVGKFHCTLELLSKNGGSFDPLPSTSTLCNDADYEWRCGKQGKALSALIKGDIP